MNQFSSGKVVSLTARKSSRMCSDLAARPVRQITFNKPLINDVPWDQARQACWRNLPEGMIVVCDIAEIYRAYEYFEALEIHASAPPMAVVAEVNYRLSEWHETVNVLTFIERLRERILFDYSITSEQKNLFEENLANVRFDLQLQASQTLDEVFTAFSEALLVTHRQILLEAETRQHQQRKIELPKHVGLPVHLVFDFATFVLRRWMPDELRVTTLSDTERTVVHLLFPRHLQDFVETRLNKIAELILGKLPPEDLFHDQAIIDSFHARMAFAKSEMLRCWSTRHKGRAGPPDARQLDDEFLRACRVIHDAILGVQHDEAVEALRTG